MVFIVPSFKPPRVLYTHNLADFINFKYKITKKDTVMQVVVVGENRY